MRRDGYRWWTERFRRTFELVDVARVDHFRGFVAYWAIPRGRDDPRMGRWHRGPGAHSSTRSSEELGHVPLIAEDLGLITPAVDRLRRELGLYGMRIVGRGFVRRHRHRHAVAAHPPDAVVYTGTHDHPTLPSGSHGASDEDLALVQPTSPPRGSRTTTSCAALVRLTLSSRARVAILPMQDVLELGADARMNRPGTFGGSNWQWRLEPGQASRSRRRAPARGDRRGRPARTGRPPRPRGHRLVAGAGYVGILSIELHFPGRGLAEGQAQVRQVGEGAAAAAVRRRGRRGRPPRPLAALAARPRLRRARDGRAARAARRRRPLAARAGLGRRPDRAADRHARGLRLRLLLPRDLSRLTRRIRSTA